MDNGYSKWKEKRNAINKKRLSFILKGSLILVIFSLFLFFFGYDDTLSFNEKIMELGCGVCGIFLLLLIVTYKRYPISKYIPICNKCGCEIKDLKNDCKVSQVIHLGTVDKTVYKNTKTTIKGKTVYPRGGYAPKNSVLEPTSVSNYEMSGSIPVVERYHVYSVFYSCKKCGELFLKQKVESLEPLDVQN